MVRVLVDDSALIDRTGEMRLATTDPSTFMIYLADSLDGLLLETVLIHEICHAIIVSYNLLSSIHMLVLPEKWIEAEECLCNFMVIYGGQVFEVANDLLGYEVRRSR